MSEKYTDYTLPETGYTVFDAQSLKSLIVQRLTDQGTFTDQIYEGSNLSSFIDVIAYSYHVLMFYLNRTSSESVFTEATIYENVNKIVKILNYNPLGYQTSTLSLNMFASEDLIPGTYTIPRYTYVSANGATYSTSTDISFTKITIGAEELLTVGENHLLKEGKWVEAPVITAIGNNFETFLLSSDEENSNIDHFNVHVYVKHADDEKYYEYREVESLYFSKGTDRVFEKRLNHDMSYEIKFGNNINGRKLIPGDKVQIYYLKSSGEAGRVGQGFLDDNNLVMLGTGTFTSIKQDIRPENLNYITYDNLDTLSMTNDSPSTFPQQRESVEEIKRKAPIHHVSRDRLVTINDYTQYLEKNYDRILSSIKVVDNNTFLDTHYKYLLQDIGISDPHKESRVLYNHLNNASAYTNNNVYIYAVPRILSNPSTQPMTTFLNPAQKRAIMEGITDIAMISHNIIIMDPVYVAVSPGLRSASEDEDVAYIENTVIEVTKDKSVSRDDAAIIEEISLIIEKYFDNNKTELGIKIDTPAMSQQILDVSGVKDFSTTRTDTGQKLPGLSLTIWNPVYDDTDIETTSQPIKLADFKHPYLFDSTNLKTKIKIVS